MTTLDQPLNVRGAPAIYRCEAGILEKLESLLQPYGCRRALVVHGERSWEAASPYWPQQTELTLLPLAYRGECTLAEASR
ncbi:oxidoreductase, partial [Bacillus cereus]|nr:oxidoreductase [Bacillus cereus]